MMVVVMMMMIVIRENVTMYYEYRLVLMWHRRCSWNCCWIVCMWSSVVLCHRRCDSQSLVCKRLYTVYNISV